MLKWIVQKIVGSKNEREVKRMRPLVDKINQIEQGLQSESDDAIRQRVKDWQTYLHRFLPLEVPTKRSIESMPAEDREQLANYLENRLQSLKSEFPELAISVSSDPESIEAAKAAFRDAEPNFTAIRNKYLDQIAPEAFAVVKNAARRLCGSHVDVAGQDVLWEMVHFDVQLIGGNSLHRGMISEMRTGEGKTLVGTLPVFLNALSGLGVHVITVNDYLAKRDSDWVGAVHRWLGLTVGCIQNQMHPFQRRDAYLSDITYGTNSEFGFDYLRDNGMASSKHEQVQRGHYFAVIDEVDSVLIDEARTPLIISGPAVHVSSQQYDQYKPMIEALVKQQNILCNELANEAKAALEAKDEVTAGRAMFKIKLGNPRNRQLLRLMEEPEMRKLIEKTELSMYQDTQKRDLFAIKEELYYTIDEKGHDSDLMEKGRQFLSPEDPAAFVLPDLAGEYAEIDADADLTVEQRGEKKHEVQERLTVQGERMHSISQLLKAYCLYEKDVEYVVKDGKVIIVDENTGREMPGRRWSDGLHQAVEAKENVEVEAESQTYATITIQNYFRLYEKLAGMTGTAETEAAEFSDIYGLDVLPIPTNRPNQRIDLNDQVFKTRREKYNAVIIKIQEAYEKGQPVLLGTASVDASETVSRMLHRAKIPHQVLNAKYHQQEAEIVAKAGQRGAVTVSTNMAGRGTDIRLGEGVAELGGLFVIGTERYQSRRVDLQLRGRCARQGDPGMSQFYISFEDDLMRNFAAADRMTGMMERFGMKEGEALEHSWLNKSVETAQKRVEQRNYIWRKRVLDFDDVMNKQREVVYNYRNEALNTEDPREMILEIINEIVPIQVAEHVSQEDGKTTDYSELLHWINNHFPLRLTAEEAKFESRNIEDNSQFLIEQITSAYELKAAHEDPQMLDNLERNIILVAIDRLWQTHLYNMDALREGIDLRAQGQKDPLVEYKNEAYKLFVELMDKIKSEALNNLFKSTTNLENFERFLHSLPLHLSGGEVEIPDYAELQAQQQLRMQQEQAMHEQQAQANYSAGSIGQSEYEATEEEKNVKISLPKRRPTVSLKRETPAEEEPKD